jgi:hypothetical protein
LRAARSDDLNVALTAGSALVHGLPRRRGTDEAS